MKNLLVLLVLLASCTPVRYVYIDPKDWVVREQRVVYDNIFVPSIVPYYNWTWYNTVPYYSPVIVQPRRTIVVPERPSFYDRTPIPPHREEPRSYPQIRPSIPLQRPEQRQIPQRPLKWRS